MVYHLVYMWFYLTKLHLIKGAKMPPLHWYNYPVHCFMQITNARSRIIYSTYHTILETNILDNIT